MTEKIKTVPSGSAGKRVFWERRIGEWERSGQTQKAFCGEHGLKLATFLWWRGQAKRRGMAKPQTPFLEIATHAGSVVEVELRSRTRLRFEGEAALQAVGQLVARVK